MKVCHARRNLIRMSRRRKTSDIYAFAAAGYAFAAAGITLSSWIETWLSRWCG
jgi:hypothetical protein